MIRFPPTEITLSVRDIDLLLKRKAKQKKIAEQRTAAAAFRQHDARYAPQSRHDDGQPYGSTIDRDSRESRLKGPYSKISEYAAMEQQLHRMSLSPGDPQKQSVHGRSHYQEREIGREIGNRVFGASQPVCILVLPSNLIVKL